MVPRTRAAGRVGLGLAAGRSRRPGRRRRTGCRGVIRRLQPGAADVRPRRRRAGASCSSTTDMPWAAHRGADAARRRGSVPGGNMMFSLVYSWLHDEQRLRAGAVSLDDVEVVVVVAELPGLRLGVWRAGRSRAPAKIGSPQRITGPSVALGHRHVIDGGGHGGDGANAGRGSATWAATTAMPAMPTNQPHQGWPALDQPVGGEEAQHRRHHQARRRGEPPPALGRHEHTPEHEDAGRRDRRRQPAARGRRPTSS